MESECAHDAAQKSALSVTDFSDDRQGRMRETDRTPSPDPTVLTSAALYREIAALRELLGQRITSLESERDRATGAAKERRDVLNRENTEQFEALKKYMELRIAGLGETVGLQFDLVERQRVEQKKDTKDAVDAALTAQKEAVKEQTTASERAIAKSETSTTKQLEQQQETVSTAIDALRRSIDEVKERIVEVDRNARSAISEVATTANGTVQRAGGAKDDRTAVYALIGVLGTVLLVVIAMLGFALAHIP